MPVFAVLASRTKAWRMPLLVRADDRRGARGRAPLPMEIYCPACRTTRDIDLRALDRHQDAAVTSLIASLSCHSCRRMRRSPSLVRLSNTSIADLHWLRGVFSRE